MRGVVRLPFAVLFSEDALGSSLSGATDRVVFTLSLPRLPADADEAGFLLDPPKNESWPCTETLGAMASGVTLVLRAARTDDGFSRHGSTA